MLRADAAVEDAVETLKQGCETRKVPARAMFQAMRALEKAKLPVRAPSRRLSCVHHGAHRALHAVAGRAGGRLITDLAQC